MKDKYVNAVILVAVASGTATVALVGDAVRGSEPLQTLFLAFLAAIIAIQVIPAIMLVAGLIRSLVTRPTKETVR